MEDEDFLPLWVRRTFIIILIGTITLFMLASAAALTVSCYRSIVNPPTPTECKCCQKANR